MSTIAAGFVSPDAFNLPDVAKAIDATETALQRQDLSPVITKVDLKGTPMRKRLPRVPANGLTHEFTQRISLGSPTSSFYADGALPPDGSTRYIRKGKQVKCLGESGRVTGLQMKGGANFANQKALEQLARLTSVLQAEETGIHFGDATKDYLVDNGDGTQTVVQLEFDGFDRIIRNEGGIYIDASAAADGPKLSIPLLNGSIQAVYDALGAPTCIEVGSREKRFFNELAQSMIRLGGDGVIHVERSLGTSVMYYDSDFGSLPILPSRYILPNGSQQTKMFVLCEKTDVEPIIEIAVLQEIGDQPLAKIDDSDRFMVNEYCVPVVRAPQWQVEIDKLSG